MRQGIPRLQPWGGSQERFDPATNTELWRRIPRWELRLIWLKAWLKRDKAARISYGAWLYANASGGGQWLAADMLDWNQEVINGR